MCGPPRYAWQSGMTDLGGGKKGRTDMNMREKSKRA